ncbi:hypothetical protein D3C72_310350 [compost metagenome]
MRLPLGLEWPRLAFAVIGFLPITALAVALFGWVPLHVTAKALVLPSIPLALGLAWRYPGWGRIALMGFLAGVVATAAYDATRLAMVWLGLWPDFIPAIGQMAALDDAAHPIWGYLWRFVGNGGGMGLTFAMLTHGGLKLGRPGTRLGMAYGAAICCCLWGTLVFAPGAQDKLFPLNLLTAAFSMLGHLDFGAVLGFLTRQWLGAPEGTAERLVPQAAGAREADAEALP